MEFLEFVAIVALVIYVSRLGGRLREAEEDRAAVRQDLRAIETAAAGLRGRVERLELRREGGEPAADDAAPVAAEAPAAAARSAVTAAPLTAPWAVAAAVTPPPVVPPVSAPPPVAAATRVAEPPAIPAAAAAVGPAMPAVPRAESGAGGAPPPLPPRVRPPAGGGVPPKAAPRQGFDWEGLVGVKFFSWAAGLLLAVAAVMFLRFSIDHGWLTTPIRMAIGLATGVGLLVACEMRSVRRYAITANAMDAAGIVILFSTLFAAHALWHLLSAPPTFALMVLVTAAAVALAVHHDSLFIALLGLLGGFATPALLASGEDRPVWLFTYLLLLNAGLAWVALRRSWPLLALLSLAGSTLYQWGWVAKFLTVGSLPLAFSIFLAFPALALVMQAAVRPGGAKPQDAGAQVARTAALSAGLPLLFAAYAATVPAYGARWALLFGFLLVIEAGLAVIAARRGPAALFPLAVGSGAVVLGIWLGVSYRPAAWPGILGFVALLVLFALAVPGLAAWRGRPLGAPGRLGAVLGCVLLAAFPVLLRLEPAAAAPWLPFGVLFVLLGAAAAAALLYEQGPLHFVAAFFGIAAEAVWSAEHLSHERLLAAIALYAIFGLFYLGVPLLARRLGRSLAPRASGTGLLLLSLLLLFFLAAGPVAQAALWGLALLLVILNAGLFLEAGRVGLSLLALAGVVLSWILIVVWWTAVPLSANLVPALFLVTGFAMLGLVGTLWSRHQAAAGGDGAAAGGRIDGLYLALVGHAFLLFVATQPALAVPPWPMLGALALLDLAIGVAALWLRRAGLWIAALAATGAILTLWVGRMPLMPGVAMAASVALAALGTVWIVLARRVAAPALAAAAGVAAVGGFVRRVGVGAMVSLLLAQVVLFQATSVVDSPGLLVTLLVEVALLAGLLWLSTPAWWPRLAPWSVASTFILAACWQTAGAADHPWWTRLVLALAVYVPYLVFPGLLGRRARTMLTPYLAAVLASAGFFLLALSAMQEGHLKDWVGALPVAQAVLLALLLVQVRRLEAPVAPAERQRGRLALVAGAALAFVTVAVPLQLEREWITIGWALLAAALAWLYTRVPHRGLLVWIAGLTAVTLVRLGLNPAVLLYHPRGGAPIWNWFLYGYLVPAVALLAAAWVLARTDDRLLPGLRLRLSAVCGTVAVVVLFLLVNIEIADAFSPGSAMAFRAFDGSAGLAENLAYTLSWGVFAILLLVAGIALRQRVTRIAAIVLLLLGALKGFLLDTSRLGGLYRVASLVGLAVCLAAVAVLIQKFVLPARQAEPDGEDGG